MAYAAFSSISVSDPRFSWVVKRFGQPPINNQSLDTYLSSNQTIQRLEDAEAKAFKVHIDEYLANALSLGVDEELIDIGASIGVSGGRLEAILKRLGWYGGESLTLEETGQLLNVSRERVRQIESQFLRRLQTGEIWKPVLSNSVNRISSLLPIPEARFSAILANAGIVRESLSMKGYLRALELFGIESHFTIFELDGQNWLSLPGANEDIDLLQKIREHAVKLTSRQGISNLEDVEDELGVGATDDVLITHIADVVNGIHALSLVHDYWLLPSDMDTRNSLRNRLRKILSVVDPISIAHARELIEREERPERSLDITDEHIATLAEYYPEFSVAANSIAATEELSITDELSDSELNAVLQIRKDGGVSSFGSIERAIVAAGGTRVTTAVTLRYSPVIVKPERDTYLVAGTHVEDARIDLSEPNQPAPHDFEEIDPEESALPVERKQSGVVSQSETTDESQSSLFGDLAIPVMLKEVIYTGSIQVNHVRELEAIGRRWGTLIDQSSNKILGFIRLSRLLNKYNAGIHQIHGDDPKLLGYEVSWNADEETLKDALGKSFAVFCNRNLNGHIEHYILFRHSFERWQRRQQ